MATKMTANGVSTTTAPGTEQYEIFYNAFRPRRKHYQYDYRHTDGDFSLVWLPLSKSADNAVTNGSPNVHDNSINIKNQNYEIPRNRILP